MKRLPDALRAEIRAVRLAKGWSQLELGQMVGLAQEHVSGIEMGKIVPRFDTMLDLLRALGLDIVVIPRALTPSVSSLVRDHRTRSGHGIEDAERPLYASDDETDEEGA